MNRIVVYALAVASSLGNTSISSSARYLQRDGEVISLGVSLDVRSPAYTTPSELDVRRVYVGTELTLTVGLGNNTALPVSVGRGRDHWASALSVRLECVSCAPSAVDNTAKYASQTHLREEPSANSTEVSPHRTVSARFELPNTSTLEPGRYKLAVSLPSDALDTRVRQLRNVLLREVTFELRSPETAAETADAYLQMADVFTQRGRHGDARQWAEKVLSVKPESVAALVEIGGSWLRENNCVMAAPILERAIRAIEAGEDTDLQISGNGREDWAAGLRGALRTRCVK